MRPMPVTTPHECRGSRRGAALYRRRNFVRVWNFAENLGYVLIKKRESDFIIGAAINQQRAAANETAVKVGVGP